MKAPVVRNPLPAHTVDLILAAMRRLSPTHPHLNLIDLVRLAARQAGHKDELTTANVALLRRRMSTELVERHRRVHSRPEPEEVAVKAAPRTPAATKAATPTKTAMQQAMESAKPMKMSKRRRAAPAPHADGEWLSDPDDAAYQLPQADAPADDNSLLTAGPVAQTVDALAVTLKSTAVTLVSKLMEAAVSEALQELVGSNSALDTLLVSALETRLTHITQQADKILEENRLRVQATLDQMETDMIERMLELDKEFGSATGTAPAAAAPQPTTAAPAPAAPVARAPDAAKRPTVVIVSIAAKKYRKRLTTAFPNLDLEIFGMDDSWSRVAPPAARADLILIDPRMKNGELRHALGNATYEECSSLSGITRTLEERFCAVPQPA